MSCRLHSARRDESELLVWLIYVYARRCPACEKVTPVWAKAVQKLDGACTILRAACVCSTCWSPARFSSSSTLLCFPRFFRPFLPPSLRLTACTAASTNLLIAGILLTGTVKSDYEQHTVRQLGVRYVPSIILITSVVPPALQRRAVAARRALCLSGLTASAAHHAHRRSAKGISSKVFSDVNNVRARGLQLGWSGARVDEFGGD